jgi:hypothetical protein
LVFVAKKLVLAFDLVVLLLQAADASCPKQGQLARD